MRRFSFPLLLILFFAVAGCDEMYRQSERDTLDREKENIFAFAHSAGCNGSSECRFRALGVKACGGPTEYVVYSTNLDTAQLIRMISEYNAAEQVYNRKWGIVSSCSAPPPPHSVRCVNNICIGYWNGVAR
jgi:hypothetical protein